MKGVRGFVKGYKQTEQHRERLIASRIKNNGQASCRYCKKPILKYSPLTKTCGGAECKSRLNKERYHNETNPIKRRADRLFASIRMGRGKAEIAYDMIQDALNSPCGYCGQTLTLENMSIDHKIPRNFSMVYSKKTRGMIYNYEELRKIDSRENLQMICRTCNSRKGDFSHDEFTEILQFVGTKPEMKRKLWRRLSMSSGFWSAKRGR